MISKKDLSKKSLVYVVLDRDLLRTKKILNTEERAILGGADLVQLRVKYSPIDDMFKVGVATHSIAKKYHIPFIVNDRVELAAFLSADGLHIGQGDISIALARRLLKKNAVIGVSVTNMRQARAAKKEGADYLGVGPVFKTPIKSDRRPKGPSLLKKVQRLKIPLFAIGGIDGRNLNILAKKGFKHIAVIRAVCAASNPYNATKHLKEILA